MQKAIKNHKCLLSESDFFSECHVGWRMWIKFQAFQARAKVANSFNFLLDVPLLDGLIN
jgi:hypothetical protein